MKVCVYNYNHKADNLVKALESEGHTTVKDVAYADLFLIDSDLPSYGDRRPYIQWANDHNIPVVIFPHGGDFRSEYDGCVEPMPVALHLVVAEGHKRLMERYGYPYRIEACGWFYSPVCEFAPREPERVLFAPIHPFVDGFQTDETTRAFNQEAYEKFVSLPGEKTCRFIGHLEPNGIGSTERVDRFIRAKPDNSYQDILAADLVISTHTFAAMAVALGVPTVMYGFGDVWHRDWSGQQGVFPKRWAGYADEVRYPYGLDDIDAACAGGPELDRWRRDFIGDPLDPAAFCALLESCLT